MAVFDEPMRRQIRHSSAGKSRTLRLHCGLPEPRQRTNLVGPAKASRGCDLTLSRAVGNCNFRRGFSCLRALRRFEKHLIQDPRKQKSMRGSGNERFRRCRPNVWLFQICLVAALDRIVNQFLTQSRRDYGGEGVILSRHNQRLRKRMNQSDWQNEFRMRMRGFRGMRPHGGHAVSIKIRVVGGAFEPPSSPNAFKMIYRDLSIGG
jgi:hypothetical protein